MHYANVPDSILPELIVRRAPIKIDRVSAIMRRQDRLRPSVIFAAGFCDLVRGSSRAPRARVPRAFHGRRVEPAHTCAFRVPLAPGVDPLRVRAYARAREAEAGAKRAPKRPSLTWRDTAPRCESALRGQTAEDGFRGRRRIWRPLMVMPVTIAYA